MYIVPNHLWAKWLLVRHSHTDSMMLSGDSTRGMGKILGLHFDCPFPYK